VVRRCFAQFLVDFRSLQRLQRLGGDYVFNLKGWSCVQGVRGIRFVVNIEVPVTYQVECDRTAIEIFLESALIL